jgi:hypothetical protein
MDAVVVTFGIKGFRRRENMAEFRYYCLGNAGKIALGEHVEATDLYAAIEHAHGIARSHPTGALPYVEVWSGTERLYSSPSGQGQTR